MLIELKERVITYSKQQYDDWKKGDYSITPDWMTQRQMIFSQPYLHFGEIFVMKYLYEAEGWKGYHFYTLSDKWGRKGERIEGIQKLEELISSDKLKRFRSMRTDPGEKWHGKGEPDLFLYQEDGRCKFVEVKKQQDKIRNPQLKCLSQILGILECPVEIVYLCEEGKNYQPKVYCLDTDQFVGFQIPG